MSYTPDLVTAVIRSLNRKNAVTRVVDPTNVRLVSVVHRDEKTLDVTLTGAPGYSNYGQITAQVAKQNIADYFTKVKLKAIPTCTSIHALLPQLDTLLGITFLPDDFEDAPITWVGNAARITFLAKATSLFWYGSQTLDVVSGDVDINTVYTQTNLNLTLKAANKKQWVDFYSTAAKRTIDLDKVDVSAPMLPADIGQTSTYNTVVALTAKPGSGMFGTKYVFYSRNTLTTYEGKTTYVPDDITDEYQEFLDYLATLDANRMASADTLDKVPDPTKPVTVEFIGTTISGALFIKQSLPGGVVGTPYGDAVASSIYTTLFGIMAHSVSEFDIVHDTWRYNRAVMFTLKPAPTGVISLAVERNRVKSGISNAPVEKFYVDRFVYYDAYLGKMMECNPYTKAAPKPWVRPKKELSTFNGELDGFDTR